MEDVTSQSDNVQEVIEDDGAAITDALAAFGISKPTAEETASEDDTDGSVNAPAIEQTEQPGKKLVVKYNKEDVEVDEDKIPEFVQKGLALDKERERRSEYEKALDRVAKQQGYKDHADLIANLDNIEQEQQKQQQDEFQELRDKLISDLEYNGADREAVEKFIENHPLLQQAKQALVEKEALTEAQKKQKQDDEWTSKWGDLYKAHPDLTESAKSFNEGRDPEWYTTPMKDLVSQGYHPLHAYQLTNLDKMQAQKVKQTEQKLLKEQRLGLRSQVETDVTTDRETQVDPELSTAFSLFGIPQSRAKKYAKK